MARISADELYRLVQQGAAPVTIDVRPTLSQDESRIPGAVTMPINGPLPPSLKIMHGGEVIVYCACPNEASAAQVAKQLMALGYDSVRPLAGGIDAWIAAGYSVEPHGK